MPLSLLPLLLARSCLPARALLSKHQLREVSASMPVKKLPQTAPLPLAIFLLAFFCRFSAPCVVRQIFLHESKRRFCPCIFSQVIRCFLRRGLQSRGTVRLC